MENLPEALRARDAAGKEFGVSGKSVDHAAGAPARAWGNILLPDVVDRRVKIGPFYRIISR